MKQFLKQSGNTMMRKFTLVISIITILFLLFDQNVYAAIDPNESIEEFYNKSKTDSTEEQPASNVEQEVNEESTADPVSVTIWDYVKMIFALLFVVLLLYGLLRFVNSRNKTFQQNSLIQNLGGVGVSQGKSVQLLQVGNSLFLVGIGEDITLLKEIEDPEEKEKLTKIYEEKQDIVGKTVPYITELVQRLKESTSSKPKSKDKKDPSFNETFQKKLREVKKDRSDVLEDWKTKEREKNE
ncbi:flagellar biosynthetic protein FliO [Psychrobacillus soli]|uniref:Flagellar protein n=1 Tax=Psychrobacillus soli TaxID=1543965 RepID=A0A544SRB5_9BACI|nr:flagellar biosynthetic protein FliO [Psychrobacillus soli]TQR07744.1 flagellar protein [Psychrobacillus soli]